MTAFAVASPVAVAPRPSARRGFLPEVHRFRGLAIMLVVAAHCWPCFAWGPRQQQAILVLLDNVTVLFMCVSGFLFQHLIPRFAYPAYLRRRLRNVMLPYVLISAPAIMTAIFVRHRDDVWSWVYRMPAWKEALFFLATGKHLAPLWFMPMISLFILAAPVFVAIDRQRAYRWLLPPTVLIATLLGRDSVPGVAGVIGKALFMLPAYLAGMAYSHDREACEAWARANVRGIAVALAVVSAAIASGLLPLDLGLVQKLLMAPLILLAMRAVATGGRLDRMLTRLATLSFGIYFVHGYVITALRIELGRLVGPAATGGRAFPPTFAGLLLSVVAVTLVSALIVEAVRSATGRYSRMLIGA